MDRAHTGRTEFVAALLIWMFCPIYYMVLWQPHLHLLSFIMRNHYTDGDLQGGTAWIGTAWVVGIIPAILTWKWCKSSVKFSKLLIRILGVIWGVILILGFCQGDLLYSFVGFFSTPLIVPFVVVHLFGLLSLLVQLIYLLPVLGILWLIRVASEKRNPKNV